MDSNIAVKRRRYACGMRVPVTLLAAAMRRILRTSMRLDHDSTPMDVTRASRRTAGQLYVHIPFCPSLCPFCTFHRVVFRPDGGQPYFSAVRREIDRCHDAGFRFQDLYVGGGTPTVLPEALGELIEHVRRRFSIRHVTVETNPSHLTTDNMARLRDAGVDRLSVGVQSFDDALLAPMGRHAYGTAAEIIAALENAAGRFPTLNVDMMFNLPLQSEASLERDLATLIDLPGVNQATFYPLMTSRGSLSRVEAHMGSPLHRERAYYERIRAALEPTMPRSSLWCFSRGTDAIDEYMADHDEYVGVGSGAFSYVGGRLFSNTFSIPRYLERVMSGRTAVTGTRALSTREQIRFDLLIKLFGLELSKSDIEAKWAGQFAGALWKERLLFRRLGIIEETSDGYRLTEAGLYPWLVLMKEFLNALNALREDMRANLTHERAQDRVLFSRPGSTTIPGASG
jgi:menaquinone C8-methyltransferase